MPNTIADKTLTGDVWQSAFTLSAIAAGTALVIQNKSSRDMLVQTNSSQPLAADRNGILIRPGNDAWVNGGESDVWLFGVGPVSIQTQGSASPERTPPVGSQLPANSMAVTFASDVSVIGAAQSVINTDLLTGTVSGWYDAKDAHSISMQIIGSAGISAGVVSLEATNDTSNASAGNTWLAEEDTNSTGTPVSSLTIAASTTRMFRAPVTARYIRIRISTAFVGGTVQVAAVLSQLPYSRMVQTVTQTSGTNLVVNAIGSTAEDAVSTSAPLIVGGYCRTATAPVTLVAGDAVRLTMAANGGAVMAPYAVPETFWGANLLLTTTTAAAAASAAGASLKRHITSFWAINTGASAVDLILLDGATERHRYTLPVNVPVAVQFPTGVGLTANTALNFNLSAAGTVRVNAHGYTGV